MSVNKMDGAVNQLSQDVMSMTQDLSKNCVDIKEEINSNVREHIGLMKDVLKEENSKSSLFIKDTMRMQMANWNYKMSDSLVEQADKMLEIANGDETDGNELSNNLTTAIEKRVTKFTTPAKRGISEISNITLGNTKYTIPCAFNTFNCIIDHYYNDVEPFEKSGCGINWRKHLTKGEQKRFQRMKKVILAFKKNY